MRQLERREIFKLIDDKLDNLIRNELIVDPESLIDDEEYGKITARFSINYWREVVSHYDENYISLLLSLPQGGNWNRFLYKAAEERKMQLITEAVEQVLLNE